MTANKNTENSMLEAALKYVEQGWAVLPLHSVVNNMCTCQKKEQCHSPGKHPRTKNGVTDATKNPTVVQEWWKRWPDSNIGLATGEISGRVVLDVDIKKGKRGDKSLDELEQEFGPLPETLTSQTGTGGWHYVFAISKPVETSEQGFREGLDFMAHQGYIVAPPSRVPQGSYQWMNQLAEADCPEWLLEVVYKDRKKKEAIKSAKPKQESDWSKIIQELLPNGEERNGEWMTHCPFHDDEHPSCSIRLSDGIFNCFACPASGTLVELVAKVNGQTEKEAQTFLGIPPKGGMNIPIVEHNGVLARIAQTKDAPQYKPITSFSMQPIKAIYVPGKGEYLKVYLKAKGKQFPVNFPPEAWLNTNSFLKWLPSKETIFWGSNQDVQFIRAYLGEFSIPTIKGTQTAGFHGDTFVTEEGAVGPHGVVPELEYVNESPSGCHLIGQKMAEPEEVEQFKRCIATFNSPKIVTTILGWTAACFLKPRLTKHLNHFPLLCLEGEPGAGKTATATNIIMKLWALDLEPKAISEQTKFTFMKLVSGSNAPPLVFEENKNWKMDPKQRNLISGLIRHTYNGFQGTRGLPNQSVNHFHYQAPLVIVGESGFAEPAVLDRMVFAHFSKEDSRPYEEGFKQLCSLPLQGLGKMLLNRVLTIGDDELKAMLEKELSQVNPQLADRPRHNAAVVRVGLRVLGEVLEMVFDLPAVDEALKEQIFENGHERKSSVDKILETMGVMSQVTQNDTKDKTYLFSEYLEEGIHYEVKDGYLRVHLAGAYPVFKKYASAYKFDGDDLDEGSFRKQLKKEVYFVENKPAQVGATTRNAWILDGKKMKEKGLEVPEEWRPVPF